MSDISTSIGLIEDFTKDLKSFTDYQRDLKTKGAVERHLGIIGEAVNKFEGVKNERASKCLTNNKLKKQADTLIR